MYRLLCLVVFAVIVLPAAAEAQQSGAAGPGDGPYAGLRRELQQARATATLRVTSAQQQLRPDVSATPALRLFVSGYTALLAYDRAKAEHDLGRSFRLTPSPYVAAALATNAAEAGLPDPVIEWTNRGLDAIVESDSRVEVELRLLRAQALSWSIRYEEQRSEVARALDLARAGGDPVTLALGLRAHAGILDNVGDKPQALAALDEAIRLSESAGDMAAVGYHLLTMTSPYYPVHPFEDKLALLDRALRIARQVHDRHLEGRLIASRGLALHVLARYGGALRDLSAADAVFRETGGLRSRATTAGNLSLVFTDLGDYDRAAQQAWLATALYRRIGNRHGVRESLDNLARIALLQGQSSLAVKRHQQVVAFTREVGDRGYLGGALVRLGLAHITRAEWEPAERAIREALTLGTAANGGDDLASAQVALGDLRRLTGRAAEAERAYAAALALATRAASTAALLIRAHHGLALLDSRAGRHQAALGHYRAALDRIEQVRDTAGRAELRLTYFSDKTALYVDAIGTLVDAHRQTGNHTHLQEALALAERAKARTLLDAVNAQAGNSDAAASLDSIAAALEPSDLLIEFVAGAARSFVFTLRRDRTVGVYQLPPRAALEEQVAALRELVTRRPSSIADTETVQRAASRAGTMLLAPVLSEAANVKRLIVVADGLLVYAPFEALTVTGTKTYVGERFEVVRAASGSVLSAMRARRARAGPVAGFVGFGDPQTTGAAQGPDAEVVRALEREGFSFGPLPGTRREVEAAGAVFAPAARLYTGSDFTAATALAELQRPSSIVHFATHAVLDERVPDRSGIVVSQARDDARAMLRARDFAALTIRAGLVVLSACQTGLGRIVDGEGVLGLAWAFTHGGAASLMVTLWNVSDAASASMMVAFYRALAAGESKSAALRTARLEMLRGDNPALRHPYFWAGYALIGDPN